METDTASVRYLVLKWVYFPMETDAASVLLMALLLQTEVEWRWNCGSFNSKSILAQNLFSKIPYFIAMQYEIVIFWNGEFQLI